MKRIVLLIALAISAAGPSAASPSVSDQRVLVVTWSVQGSAALTRNHDTYEEVGNMTVVWRVPVSGLTPGQRFLATSASATGTTSAVFGSGTKTSCRGPLSPSRSRLELRVIQAGRDQPSYGTVNFIVSNPFESATSLTCPEGTRASHPARSDVKRERWWRNYTRVGVNLVKPTLRLYPKWNPVGNVWSFPPSQAAGETAVRLQFVGWIRVSVTRGGAHA